jgi:hypothetical protein
VGGVGGLERRGKSGWMMTSAEEAAENRRGNGAWEEAKTDGDEGGVCPGERAAP